MAEHDEGPSPEPDYLSVINMLWYEGDQPVDGFWYAPDEDGIPRYKGRAITPAEQLALDQVEEMLAARNGGSPPSP